MGHEIAHFEESHTVENYYAQKHRMTAALVVGIGVGVAGAVAAANAPVTSTQSIVDSTGHLIDAVYLTAIASYFAFSRKQEAQADSLGFESAVSNGYDPKAGSAMWRYLISEQKASDFARVRDRGAKAGIFDTHPLEETRIAALDALAAGRAPGRTERAAYRAMIRPHLDAWLRDDLRRRDFGQSLFLIDRMTASGEDLGVLNFYKGEAFRLRRKDGDLALARAAYAAAIAQPDAPAAAWREIADIDLRDGRRAEARAALVRYMEMAPQASDKALVATRIASLADVAPPPPPEPPAPADAPAPSGDAQPNPGGQTP
jgi:predicted Zn-dependent protease